MVASLRPDSNDRKTLVTSCNSFSVKAAGWLGMEEGSKEEGAEKDRRRRIEGAEKERKDAGDILQLLLRQDGGAAGEDDLV